ncbi:MAG TPA: PAS domain-containing sensor histidine kinase, partial [Candidatus Krumholzibacteria bacterium]|nr:PAS domain-containing sensor histidine kinase [Candidatus Krumholzibacteria bacterium]
MDEHDLYMRVIDAIRDPVLVVDATGEVLLANPAALRMLELGREPRPDSRRPALDGAAIMDLVRRAERVRLEAAPYAGDPGQVIDVEPLPGPGRCWMMRVRAADTLAREFWSDSAVATVAHEIRNPITAMLNALDTLAPPPVDAAAADAAPPARRAFERSTRRLARLVDGLLDLSRARTGALELQRAPVSVREFIGRVVDDFRVLHPAAAGRIHQEPVDADLRAYVDADRAEQALWNLLSNSVRFTPRTESVSVRVSRAGMEAMEDDLRLVPWDVVGHPRLVRIEVEDSGLGMTPETMEHLFERHHAAGTGQGAHLGLSITRALIDAHDGWMAVDSRLGEGTAVSMFVPGCGASAALLRGVRMAAREAMRRNAAHRPAAVALLERTGGPSWTNIVPRWPREAVLQPREPVSPRDCAVWALSADIAVALLPLPVDGDVASVLGAPREAVEDGSWRMDGFIVGWCGEREQVSFAQALHRAAARMV